MARINSKKVEYSCFPLFFFFFFPLTPPVYPNEISINNIGASSFRAFSFFFFFSLDILLN